jgi:hypothetical protein
MPVLIGAVRRGSPARSGLALRMAGEFVGAFSGRPRHGRSQAGQHSDAAWTLPRSTVRRAGPAKFFSLIGDSARCVPSRLRFY